MDRGRRGFLAGLLGAPAASGVLLAGGATMPADDFVQDGWRFRWIDYQQLPAMDVVYGVWIAERLHLPEGVGPRYAHWSTRGRGDWHQKGYTFDLTGVAGWPDLDGGASEQDKRAAKRRAFLALKAFING